MYHAPLIVLLASLGLGPVHAFELPGAISTEGLHPKASPHLLLHPGVHPDVDKSDLDNLKAKKSNSLYYAAPPGSPTGAAAVMEVAHLYPAVQLERSHFVNHISCNAGGDSISLTFTDLPAFQAALDDWETHPAFLLISYVEGCGSGMDTFERSFHLILNVTGSQNDLTIVCRAKTIPIQDTVHRDQEIRLHAATYDVQHRPQNSKHGSPHPAHGRGLDARSTDLMVYARDIKSFSLKFIAAVLRVLSGFYTLVEAPAGVPFKEHVNEQASFDTQNLRAFDGTFTSDNDSYLIYRKDFAADGSTTTKNRRDVLVKNTRKTEDRGNSKTGTGTDSPVESSNTTEKYVEFLCVGCGVVINIRLAANVVGTLGGGLNVANVQLEGDITATLVFGIKATSHSPRAFSVKDESATERRLLEAGIPHVSLKIQGILEIGSFVTLDVALTFSLQLQGMLSAGFICKWTKIGANLDLKTPSKSGILGDWGVGGNCKRVVDAALTLTVEIEPAVKIGLLFKVSVLPGVTGKLAGEASLVEKLSLVLTASVTAAKNGNCPPRIPRFEGKLKSLLYLSANTSIGQLEDYPLHKEYSVHLFDNIPNNPFEGSERQLRPAPSPGFPKQPASQMKIVPALKPGKTTVAWDEKGVFMSTSGDANKWPFLSRNGIVYATSSKEFLCATSNLILSLGFARLKTCSRSPPAAGFTEIGLGKAADTTYLVAADMADAYTLITCCPTGRAVQCPVYISNSTDVQPAKFNYTGTEKNDLFGGYPDAETGCLRFSFLMKTCTFYLIHGPLMVAKSHPYTPT
ncbi:hypothetical protein C8F04DRAFT_1185747 [Mycena alexandri]|uniref:DUF7029 domain-containing protein n=1 Tax=Mycena alexandri TaxID=1745969 RepID=A0AAD6SPB7_9AGAR|nr:hypothetical protein C8F04DRAFT_1185747 [Mycena alexandri]